jgi:hypothetical protein
MVVGHTKKQFQITNLLEVNSKLESSTNKFFINCNVSKCSFGFQNIEEKSKLVIFFNVF